MLKTLNDYREAIKKIHNHPNNHGFSESEYESIVQFESDLKDYSAKITSSLNKITENLNKAVAKFRFSQARFLETFQEFRFVVNLDWYISFNLLKSSSLQEVFNLIFKKKKELLESFVIEKFPIEKKSIFHFIRETVPHRSHLITEVEKLYDHKYYSALITLCYTQIDGICNENLGYGFFDTNKNNELKISELESTESLASKIALQLKESRNEINRYVKPEIKDGTFNPDSFNRHLVVHGHSIHFGNRLNALRAILLLDFICALIKEGIIRKSE